MSKPIPSIQKWMSTTPITINRGATLADAHVVMRREGIRHLPVMEGSDLVGILSRSDMHLIESLSGVDSKVARVEDAMTLHPYSVGPGAGMDEVVGEMAERKIGTAVVLQNCKVVGIFSAVDALRAFAELLHGRLAS